MTSSPSLDGPQDELLRAKLNLETATINWLELQRHFAAGRLIWVSGRLDLVEVALQLTKDNKSQFQAWIDSGQVSGVTEAQANDWYARKQNLWALVVAPWVLVQDKGGTQH